MCARQLCPSNDPSSMDLIHYPSGTLLDRGHPDSVTWGSGGNQLHGPQCDLRCVSAAVKASSANTAIDFTTVSFIGVMSVMCEMFDNLMEKGWVGRAARRIAKGVWELIYHCRPYPVEFHGMVHHFLTFLHHAHTVFSVQSIISAKTLLCNIWNN